MGSNPMWLVSLWKEQLVISGQTCPKGRVHMNVKAEKEWYIPPHGPSNTAGKPPDTGASSQHHDYGLFQKREIIHLCWLRHLACGTFLQHPWETEVIGTSSKLRSLFISFQRLKNLLAWRLVWTSYQWKSIAWWVVEGFFVFSSPTLHSLTWKDWGAGIHTLVPSMAWKCMKWAREAKREHRILGSIPVWATEVFFAEGKNDEPLIYTVSGSG